MATTKKSKVPQPSNATVPSVHTALSTAVEEDEWSEVLPLKYSITSYGADYTVDGLVKRLNEESIFVPQFQRGYVWKPEEASRFIESLLLGLPVPGIFLSKEKESQRLLVIDGQQRLITLWSFYRGKFPDGKAFRLTSVQKRFADKTYQTLDKSDRIALDDSIIHATIVKQENPKEDNSSVYYIFERLNTGGVRLEPQEIRASVYHGSFNDLLKELNKNDDWRALYGPISKNMRDQEMILRFFALYFYGQDYKEPMKAFLNDYMSKNVELKVQDSALLSGLFVDTVALTRRAIGIKAFKPSRTLNAAVCDSIMVGLACRVRSGRPVTEDASVLAQYTDLLNTQAFIDAVRTGTGQEEKVRQRLSLSKKAFADVK